MIERVLVWRTGALGDFVCTLPVIHALRARARHLTVIGPGRLAGLVPDVDRWIDAEGLEVAGILAGRARVEADLAVAWTPTAAETLRSSGVGAVCEGTPVPVAGTHACDHLWQPVRALLGPRDRDPRVTVAPERARAMGSQLGGRVVLAPGSGGRAKRWPLERWREVASRIQREVVWVGGPAEAGEPGWGSPRRDDLGVLDLAALAATCHAWLGPDSGPGHLAAAAGARVGVVFVGTTDPAVWAPPGSEVFVTRAKRAGASEARDRANRHPSEPSPEDLARWADATPPHPRNAPPDAPDRRWSRSG